MKRKNDEENYSSSYCIRSTHMQQGFLKELDVLLGFLIGGENLNSKKYVDESVLITNTE